MAIGTLLGSMASAQDMDKAFKVFDEVRRPRCQQVIDSSRGTGQIFCGQNEEVGLDPDRLRAAMMPWLAFIFGLDLV